MPRTLARIFCLFVLILATNFAVAQAEFSAEIVNLDKPGSPPVKVSFAKDKMRAEVQGGAHGGGTVIVNFATQTSTVIMPQQHMYLELPAQSSTQRIGYNFFQTGDVENACSDWQKSLHGQGGTCHKVGNETINGRSTVKYEAVNSSGEVSHFWLDPKLRFPVKWQGKSGGGELRNIQEGAQPASSFEIPAGFTKMDMGGMMRQPQ